jgi:hypothetical protein
LLCLTRTSSSTAAGVFVSEFQTPDLLFRQIRQQHLLATAEQALSYSNQLQQDFIQVTGFFVTAFSFVFKM